MKQITLGGDRYVLVDDEDYRFLTKYKWRIKEGYAMSGGGVAMHQMLLGWKPGYQIDHKNRNRLDNQRSNLRFCLPGMNCKNRSKSKDTSSTFKGVCWDNRKRRWRVQVMCDRKTRHIAMVSDEHIAALMYDFWATFKHGEYASPNFTVVSQWTNPRA